MTASASDDRGDPLVEFYINDILVAVDTTPPYQVRHTLPLVTADELVTVAAHAVDASGVRCPLDLG